MNEKEQAINRLLVQLFHDVLRIEEQHLGIGRSKVGLSLKELHVIDTVAHCQQTADNQPTRIAQRLGVTPGTLTTSINLLVKKGYLARTRDEKDGRIKRIALTEKGENANLAHRRFHEEMVQEVLHTLTPEESQTFVRGLDCVDKFFEKKYRKGVIVP